MTLIEVLVGLALIGALLVSILLAKGRATRQRVQAERRIAAVAVADELLTAWWKDVDRFPRSATGNVRGPDGFAWRTRVLSQSNLPPVKLEIVRVELIDRAARALQQPVLVSIDVVLPEKTKP